MSVWSKAEKRQFAVFIILMFDLCWIAMKVSLPALPKLIEVFHTSPSNLKLSVALFFASIGLSQLFWGVIAEKKGRRFALLIGFGIALVGTGVVTFSYSVTQFIIGRSIEGLGLGVVSPVGRAMLADIYEKFELARLMTILGSTTSMMPALAPIVGGFILVYLGWRMIFIFFFILSFSFLIWMYFKLTESSPQKKQAVLYRDVFKQYFTIVKNKFFWGYMLSYILTESALLGYYCAMPFWYVTQWHIKAQHFAFLAIFNVAAYLISLYTTRAVLKKYSIEFLIRVGILLGGVTVLFAFLSAVFDFRGPVPLVMTSMLLALSAGVLFPSSNAGGLSHFKVVSASMSALTATLAFLSVGLFAWILSHLSVVTLWSYTFFLLTIVLLSGVVNYLCMPTLTKKN
jgi:MFS family permease